MNIIILFCFCHGNSGSWASHHKNLHQWIQAEFAEPLKVTAIQTQGRSDGDNWVKTYKISYGNDGIHWSHAIDKYGEEMVRPNINDTKYNNNNRLKISATFSLYVAFFF